MEDWTLPMPAGYNNANRAFLQAFLARGSFTFPEGQDIIAGILTAEGHEVDPGSISEDDLDQYVKLARDVVESLDYDIRVSRNQLRPERVWALVNAESDPTTHLATSRTPDEIAYVKRLLDAMFDVYNSPRMEVMAVDENQALKVSRPRHDPDDDEGTQSRDNGLRHGAVLSLLASLIEEGWLEKSTAGFFSLTTRSLLELGSWLVATYNDPSPDVEDDWQRIKPCVACKEIITYGQRCPEIDCTVRLHDICQAAFWRTRNDKKCPKCGTDWDGQHYVGERAVTSRHGYQRGKGRRSGGTLTRSDLAAAIAARQEETDEDDDLDD